MRLIAVLTYETQIAAFATAGAGGILVPVEGFAVRSKRRFSVAAIRRIVSDAHALGLTVHLRMNHIIHETDLERLRSTLKELADVPFDRLVCFDLTVAIIAAELGMIHKVIYQPGTLATNVYDPGFYAKLGLKGLTLSPDIQINELMEIAKAANGIECSLVGHGYLPMLISKRNLLTAYYGESLNPPSVKNDFNYHLTEEKRPGELLPILEDEVGTHLFRAAALASFEELPLLQHLFADVYIETNFIPEDEVLLALMTYTGKISKQTFFARSTTPYDSGFYNRPTAAKKEAVQ
jgi:U32 family peptidase